MSYQCNRCQNRVAFRRRVTLVETYAFDVHSEPYAVEHSSEELEDVHSVCCAVYGSDNVEWGVPYPSLDELDSTILTEHGYQNQSN